MTPQGRFVALTALRWIPAGLTIPVTVLFALDRGLTLPEVGIAFSIQGFVVLVLELPSGALADSWGRRPVLLLASSVSLVAAVLLVFAHSLPVFITVYAIQGVFRALDSGVLEAWFADAAIATGIAGSLERGLAAAGTALGLAIGGGAISSSGLVLLAPLLGLDPLALPIAVSAFFVAVYLVAVLRLVRDDPTASVSADWRSAFRAIPAELAAGVRLLGASRILAVIVAVELFWGFGMVAFETFTPVRLSEVIGDSAVAATTMGPVTAAGWLLFAAGSALAGRLGVDAALIAALLRILQGATVVVLGLAAGAVGVIAGFLACYAVHGASNPPHNTLLHRQVTGSNRATVLSLNSMVGQPAGAFGSLVLGGLAGAASVSTAIVTGGVVLAAAAPLYLWVWARTRRP